MVTQKRKFWRGFQRWSALLKIAAFFLLFSPCATRAELQFDVIVGFNGVVPHNAWLPITCELLNDGPSFKGVIEVSEGQLGGGQTRQLPLELPTNTRKRVMIPVFSDSGNQGWKVRLLTERGKLIAEPNYVANQKISGTPALASLARNFSGAATIPEGSSRNMSQQVVAARLQTELFPENPIVLEGLPMLYLNSQRALELSVAQVNALLAWLHRGGHLVVGIEQAADLNATEWLRNISPCDLTQMTEQARHPALQNWMEDWRLRIKTSNENLKRNQNGQLKDPDPLAPDATFESASLPILTGSITDGKVLIGTSAAPLAIQALRGCGRITILTFSPEREPFVSWKNRPWFWAKLAEVPIERYAPPDQNQNHYAGLSSDGVFGSMVDSKQVRKLPLGWLLLLLVVYLVVIGPLDRYWLKKTNRQMLTWITFPGYVVGFSGLIYLIGFYLRAGDLESNELSVVDIQPAHQLFNSAKTKSGAETILRGQTYCSVYSPVNGSYQFTAGQRQPFAVFRDEFLDQGRRMNSRANVLQRANAFEAQADISVWTSRLFVSDWIQSSPAPLTMEISPLGKGWNVRVENKTDHKINKAQVVIAGRIYELGDLPPLKMSVFSVETENGKILSQIINPQAGSLKSAAQRRNNSFGDNANYIPDPALGATAISFASLIPEEINGWNNFATPQGLDLGKLADREHAILLAWDANYSYSEPLNRFNVRRTHRDTLLRLVIPLKTS